MGFWGWFAVFYLMIGFIFSLKNVYNFDGWGISATTSYVIRFFIVMLLYPVFLICPRSLI